MDPAAQPLQGVHEERGAENLEPDHGQTVVRGVAPDRAGHQAPEDGSPEADQDRPQTADGLTAGHDEPAEGSDQQAADDDAENEEHPCSLARRRRHEKNAARERQVTEVRAEIAASVWQVHSEVGQQVTEGDTIAILESMKMEIPVEAPVDGVILEIRVAPDDQVQEGDVIAVIG